MMIDLLLNKSTRIQTELFIKNASHALLITGDMGSGKASLAQYIASELLEISSHQLQNHPYFTHLARIEDKSDISIDSIRRLYKLLKLKAPGNHEIRRVIFIEDAQHLNEEASNALLKMLEEPSSDCVFILTATSIHDLLPTIGSRAQHLQVKPISLDKSLEFLKDRYKVSSIESAWRLSGGSAGLMLAILNEDNSHPLKIAIEEAKDYLRKTRYDRALLSDSLGRNKAQLSLVLEALVKVLGAVQHAGLSKSNKSQQINLLQSRKLVIRLQKALDTNASPRLIALELSLNLI